MREKANILQNPTPGERFASVLEPPEPRHSVSGIVIPFSKHRSDSVRRSGPGAARSPVLAMNRRLLLTRLTILVVAPVVLVTRHLYHDNSLAEVFLESVGILLLILAMGGRIWASAHLAGKRDRELITGGPYARTRNPLYLFSLIGFIGAGLVFGSVLLALLFAVVFFTFHWPTILREEAKLEGLFGEDYRSYRAEVPRFLPTLRPRSSRQTITVHTPHFLRMLRDALAIPLIIVVADVLDWAQATGVAPVLLELP